MSTDFAKEKATARERTKALLSDMNWHKWSELVAAGGIRYGARLLEIKRLGYQIESDGDKVSGKRYRLISNVPGVPQEKKVKLYLPERDVEILLGMTNERRYDRLSNSLSDALGSFRTNKAKL